jgi:ABC-2 type transport system permease protein
MTTTALSFTPRQRRAFGLLVASEIKIAVRRPVGLLVAVGIPFVLLVIFGSIPATTRPDQALGGISFFNLYVPTLMVFVLIAVGLAGLPQQLAAYRQQGVLRRMSTTPVPPSWLLAAQTTVSLILAVIGIGILLGAGAGAFGLALPHDVGGYLVSFAALILTAAATIGLGLLVASVARTPQIAQALTVFLFYPLAFFSGLYVPIQEIHSQLVSDISKVLPTGAGFTALHAAFGGQTPGVEPLLVLVVWAVGSCVAASRLFRWE